MTYLAPLPGALRRVEYVQLYFHLQVKDSFDLPPMALLQLRRELLQALRTLTDWGDGEGVLQAKNLFHPPVSLDPMLRRLAQKPAPAFVLKPDPQTCGLIKACQRLVLPVLFVGQGIPSISVFVSLLQQLGQQGLCRGNGQFVVDGVESEDASGVRAMLWSDGQRSLECPPVGDLFWLLERQSQAAEHLSLEVISPLRLLKLAKPLFKVDFCELFPFVLRRVTSMLASHAGVEVIKEPKRLLELARQVVVQKNSLQWQDWRQLQGETRAQDLGGLLGQMTLSGEPLAEIFWVLQLGSFLNLGKGAAYGAGQYRLSADPERSNL